MSRTNLQTISTPDLLKEIQRREKAAKAVKAIPAAIPDPDFQPLITMVDKMLTTAATEEYWEEDNRHSIYEEVMKAIYGNGYFGWRDMQDWY